MARFRYPNFSGGLNTLDDALAAPLNQSPDCKDVRFSTGLLSQRKGYRMLAMEPSWRSNATGLTKNHTVLAFDGSDDYAAQTSFDRQLGSNWTIRMDIVWAIANNDATGTYVVLLVKGTTHNPVRVYLTGSGTSGTGTIVFNVTIKDNAGTTVTLSSAAQTVNQWTTSISSRFVRIVRDGSTVSLYIAETLIDSDTLGTGQHEVSTGLYLGADSTPANYSKLNAYGLTVVNETLGEDGCYFGLGFPADENVQPSVLASFSFNEGTGTSVYDYSSYRAANGSRLSMTIHGATWSGGNNRNARGLLIHSHRDTDGKRYHVIGCTRNGTSSAGAVPSGALYMWEEDEDFFPLYFGNDAAADDATADLSGLALYARMQALSILDDCYIFNGTDYNRRIHPTPRTVRYMGITAPAVAPYVTVAGSGGLLNDGAYKYCFTYLNSTLGVESGASPSYSVTATSGVPGANTCLSSVRCWYSDDPQVDIIRVWRTVAGGNTFFLVGQVSNSATLATSTLSDGVADASITSLSVLTGGDTAGNWTYKRSYKGGGPLVAMTLGSSLTGITGTFYYAYEWYNTAANTRSGLSPPATITVANKQVDISGMIVPATSQWDTVVIYRTADLGSEFKIVKSVSVVAVETDTTADGSLSDVDWSVRELPPVANYAVLFANRVWTLKGQTVSWSTAGDYEAFPFGNSHTPNPGATGTALVATEGALYLHWNDGRIFILPHPGNTVDLSAFVPVNMREWSPVNGALSHWSVQKTPYGTMWLGNDGFYLQQGGAIRLASPTLTPDFLNVSQTRAQYAYAMYSEEDQVYRCWLSRGQKRLNEECFVYDFRRDSWTIDQMHADAAGVLYDGKEVAHECILVENGVLAELLHDGDTGDDKDGDGSGTMSGAVSSAGLTTLADLGSYTAPAGASGGYPIWFVKSDNTAYQRYRLPTELEPVSNNTHFYPSLSALASGSWTQYYHGIRGEWTTMWADMGDPRPDKTFQSAYVTHGIQSAGTLRTDCAVDEEALAESAGPDISLASPMTSQVTLGTTTLPNLAGRYLQLRFVHDPPSTNQPWRMVAVEIEGDFAGDTA